MKSPGFNNKKKKSIQNRIELIEMLLCLLLKPSNVNEAGVQFNVLMFCVSLG